MSLEKASLMPLTGLAVRRWTDQMANRSVYLGLSVVDAMAWATSVWRRGQSAITSLSFDESLPDRLYALSNLAAASEADEASLALEVSVACFQALERIDWEPDQVGEKADLLGRFGYLAWLAARRTRRWSEMFAWERRTVAVVLEQESVRDFLAVPAVALSDEVGSRFLSEPPLLLAVCVRLRELMNQCPARAFQDAAAVHGWVVRHRGRGSEEEQLYFQAELGVILGAAAKNCGRFQETMKWLDAVDQACREGSSLDCVFARSSFLRTSVAYESRNYLHVLEQIPVVAAKFEALGMENYVARCTYLKAAALKDVGRDDEALGELRRLLSRAAPGVEPWLRGLAMTVLAEIEGRHQQFELAVSSLASAWESLKEGCVPLVLAHFHAVRGELQRDHEQLEAATASYRAAVSIYLEAGMASQAAYIGIVLAETLIAAGREDEAIDEILRALPAIEELNLVREGVVAIAFLRESLRRRKADRDALMALRIQLQRMREGDRS